MNLKLRKIINFHQMLEWNYERFIDENCFVVIVIGWVELMRYLGKFDELLDNYNCFCGFFFFKI